MPLEPAYVIHLLIGTTAVAAYWAALLARKGSRPHKRAGRVFLGALGVVLASVGGIFFLSSRAFSGPEVVQFTYLVLCVMTVAGTAFAAIRLRREVARFRGRWFLGFGVACFVMGLVVLAAGIATQSPVAVLFSTIGLIYGGAMIRFVRFRGALHPNWWLGWHLNGMCYLFNAVHGTLLAVLWRWLVDPAAGDGITLVTQTGTMAVALGLRLWFGARVDAPLRFGAPQGALRAA